MDLNIETDADLQEIDKLLSQQQHSFAGFARQIWAYITVNQLLAERWDNSRVKHFCRRGNYKDFRADLRTLSMWCVPLTARECYPEAIMFQIIFMKCS